MIPVRIELKNFMSYGEEVPPLDLTGMHTICLSGENGNGKSALLDAITWSLWGESRAGKNRHDDLVRIGADEMSVQFTFEMDGQTYRVMRKRSKRASGNQWELQQDSGDGTWRSLTGNNSGETEKAIQKLLRMSYDTFLNSAYLRQGQADQFVKQPPGKRKEILADILDLSRYDQLEQKARERARESAAEAVDVEREINVIDAELAQEDGFRETLKTLQTKLAELHENQNGVRRELAELNKQIGQIQGQKAYADGLELQLRTIGNEIRALEAQIKEHAAEEERWKSLLAEKDAIEAKYAELVAAREQMAALDADLRRFHKGQGMVAEVESQYAIAANEARRQYELLAVEVQTAEKKLCDLPELKQQHAAISARLSTYDRLAADRETVNAERTAVQDQLRKLEIENVTLSQQITGWENRLESLAAQNGVCMVCNAPLSPERAQVVRAEYEAERQKSLDQRKLVWAEAKVVKQRAGALDEQLAKMDADLAGATQDRVLLGQVELRLKEFDTVAAALPDLKSKLVEAKNVIEQETFAIELKKKLDSYRLHLQKLEQTPQLHNETRLRLVELEPFERKHLELSHAADALATAEARARRDRETLDVRGQTRKGIEEQLKEVAGAGTALDDINAQCGAKQGVLNALLTEERGINLEIGRMEQRIESCEKMRGERAGKLERLTSVRKDHEAYDQLTKAFGKKGVQALIIENAIPEIQEEANRLLERLTDGDMSIYFETLREAKTKREGPIETLDIKVSDSLGTRPLEMYSGGEGFRAAFALRIALSKLLARRAGAKLQTLIIDEGFGTQDGKGREKLIDALNAIKEDFEKIIVITHIDELKDAFATRVEVVKTPMGSQITIMEGANG
jgi:exonuclease SbcC